MILKRTTFCTSTISSSPSLQVLRDHRDIQSKKDQEESDDEEMDFEALFEEAENEVDGLEKAWRYAKKPLLSIGSKGATLTQGNSLRQMLDQHTVVKVKVNTRRFNGSLEEAFDAIKALVVSSGGNPNIELVQAREGEKIIMFGLPGTLERIQRGDFPPQP